MSSLQGLVAFAETVQRGSFAAASRALGLSPSAVAKVVARFEDALGARHPRLALDLTFSDRYDDIVRGGYDAAVRVGELADSSLVAHRFGTQSFVMCAAPPFLARHGTPRRPEDLDPAHCLAFRMLTTGRPRPWSFARGNRNSTFVPLGAATMDDGEALVAGAAAGLGIVQVPDYMVQEHVAAGRLVEVLAAFRPLALPISLVYSTSRQVTPRLRVLVEALTGRQAVVKRLGRGAAAG